MDDLEAAAMITALGLPCVPVGGGDRCILCGAWHAPYLDGRASLCGPCSYAELGHSAYAISLATEFGKSIAWVERKFDADGHPGITPKRWLTSQAKLRAHYKGRG